MTNLYIFFPSFLVCCAAVYAFLRTVYVARAYSSQLISENEAMATALFSLKPPLLHSMLYMHDCIVVSIGYIALFPLLVFGADAITKSDQTTKHMAQSLIAHYHLYNLHRAQAVSSALKNHLVQPLLNAILLLLGGMFYTGLSLGLLVLTCVYVAFDIVLWPLTILLGACAEFLSNFTMFLAVLPGFAFDLHDSLETYCQRYVVKMITYPFAFLVTACRIAWRTIQYKIHGSTASSFAHSKYSFFMSEVEQLSRTITANSAFLSFVVVSPLTLAVFIAYGAYGSVLCLLATPALFCLTPLLNHLSEKSRHIHETASVKESIHDSTKTKKEVRFSEPLIIERLGSTITTASKKNACQSKKIDSLNVIHQQLHAGISQDLYFELQKLPTGDGKAIFANYVRLLFLRPFFKMAVPYDFDGADQHALAITRQLIEICGGHVNYAVSASKGPDPETKEIVKTFKTAIGTRQAKPKTPPYDSVTLSYNNYKAVLKKSRESYYQSIRHAFSITQVDAKKVIFTLLSCIANDIIEIYKELLDHLTSSEISTIADFPDYLYGDFSSVNEQLIVLKQVLDKATDIDELLLALYEECHSPSNFSLYTLLKSYQKDVKMFIEKSNSDPKDYNKFSRFIPSNLFYEPPCDLNQLSLDAHLPTNKYEDQPITVFATGTVHPSIIPSPEKARKKQSEIKRGEHEGKENIPQNMLKNKKMNECGQEDKGSGLFTLSRNSLTQFFFDNTRLNNFASSAQIAKSEPPKKLFS